MARKKARPQPALARPPKGNQVPVKDPDEITPEQKEQLRQLALQRQQNGGWSEKPPDSYQDFPLITTKRALREGLRYHIMRMAKVKGEGVVDVTDQEQFPRPVTLLRRDPRLPSANRMAVKEEPAPLDPAEAAELERIQQLKAEKEAQRALDQAQIAPVARSNEPKPKQNNNKKEKLTSFYGRNSEAQKMESKIHYEETWPWHLEDAEGKAGVWVGSYVASRSHSNVALVIDGSRFRMIPLERYYKFDEKPRFETLPLDVAEKMMAEVKQVKRWIMKQKEDELLEKEKNETRNFLRGPTRVKTESATSRMARRGEREDDFELDVSGDEFQDDDETPDFLADEDEDAKESKTRIRREQVSANTFGEGEEDKVEQEERERQLEKLRRKMMGKRTMKSLKKLEHAMDFDDDSESEDNNPFTDHEVSAAPLLPSGRAIINTESILIPTHQDSDEESDSADRKEGDEAKKAEQKEQTVSGANSKGNTTPASKQRAADAAKKGKLKRPGSPNMTDSSENEAARKKLKTGQGSVAASRSATPLPGRPKTLGATSDGEATAGEASDGGEKLKMKLKVKPAQVRAGGTPSGSRAVSPAPAGKPFLSLCPLAVP